MLAAKAAGEVEWLNRIDEHAGGKFALIGWSAGEIKGNLLLAQRRINFSARNEKSRPQHSAGIF